VSYPLTFNRDSGLPSNDNFAIGILSFGGVMTNPPVPAGVPANQWRAPYYAAASLQKTGPVGSAGWYAWGKNPAGTPIAAVTDGTSNTMLLSEQSDYCVNSAGTKTDCRSDYGHGFGIGPIPWNEWRIWQATVVRYGVNEKRWNLKGVSDTCGLNMPLQSAHAGGVNAAMADGSVRFLTDATPLQTLYDLANRDDGAVVGLP
jgi:prepilin-type processing-associated H-X9-DG protein